MFYKILEAAKEHSSLSKKQIIELLLSKDQSLFETANKIREKTKGNGIHLRALIEFTNFCRCNCYYCGLRYDNHKIKRYRLTEDQILLSVDNAMKADYKTIVLQGGEDMFWSKDKFCNLIKKIKEYDVALTLSIGERPKDEYKAFKDAGTDRFLLRIETTDKTLYRKLHPNMSFENRLRCLKDLKELGFETGTGCLVGLPNQTIESLADDILFFKELNADMVGIGPFIPHPNTPLANEKKDNFELLNFKGHLIHANSNNFIINILKNRLKIDGINKVIYIADKFEDITISKNIKIIIEDEINKVKELFNNNYDINMINTKVLLNLNDINKIK